jgi:hypothetical protein
VEHAVREVDAGTGASLCRDQKEVVAGDQE